VVSVKRREVIVAVADGVKLLDLAGPIQVLNDAGRYRLRLASMTGEPVRTDVGMTMSVELALTDLDEPVDTVLVPGYPREEAGSLTADFVAAIGAAAQHARRVVSICTGAYLLAEAGLLDGRRATTHWEVFAEVTERYPRTEWERDALYVRDGPVVTSAGVSAGIDLALALVGEDHGQDLARSVARSLVVFLQRPGGQSQFSVRQAADTPRHPVLAEALRLVSADPAGDHRLSTLAAELSISERHLTRIFRRELGTTPGRFVERIRVEAAQSLLEADDIAVGRIAAAVGFGSQETLRQAFHRTLGITPAAYRHRFRLADQQSRPAVVARS
jgi:transcriptional regulator GlxA family with amidase domain